MTESIYGKILFLYKKIPFNIKKCIIVFQSLFNRIILWL